MKLKAPKFLKKTRIKLAIPEKILRRSTKAVLFDMDGVLVDSSSIWWKSFDRTLKKFGSRGIAKKAFLEKYWGGSVDDNISKMRRDFRNAKLGNEAIKYCKLQFKILSRNSKLYSGVKPSLAKIKKKFKTALVTNTPRKEVFEILKKLGIEKYFDAVIAIEDVSEGKPSPEPVKKACRVLKINARRAVLIGDTCFDFLSGKRAGCKVIGMRFSADERIESISELPRKLGLKD